MRLVSLEALTIMCTMLLREKQRHLGLMAYTVNYNVQCVVPVQKLPPSGWKQVVTHNGVCQVHAGGVFRRSPRSGRAYFL